MMYDVRMNIEKQMKCPRCKSDLVQGKDMPLETLSEHVCDPNGTPCMKPSYHCSNPNCEAGHEHVIWDQDGETYGGRDIKWIDDNNAPFGSFQRKCNVEIYKKDENYQLCRIPCWPLKDWKVKVNYYYGSNEDGDILSRKAGLEWITNEGVWYIWGTSMLRFGLSQIYRDWKTLRSNPNDEFVKGDLIEYVERAKDKDAQWWRKLSGVFARLAIRNLRIA